MAATARANRVFMVTGASSGIGVKIAEGIARRPGSPMPPQHLISFQSLDPMLFWEDDLCPLGIFLILDIYYFVFRYY